MTTRAKPAARLPDAVMAELIELEREIRAYDADAREARRQLRAIADVGYIYVIEFESTAIKVGRSSDPLRRLAQHAEAANVYGVDVANSWVSERHYGCSKTERDLIKFCVDRGRLVRGKEYFRDVPFALARNYAKALVDRELITRKRDDAAETLALITASVDAMIKGSGGDDTASAVEAWQRGSGGGEQ